jgi:hypothetical protein
VSTSFSQLSLIWDNISLVCNLIYFTDKYEKILFGLKTGLYHPCFCLPQQTHKFLLLTFKVPKNFFSISRTLITSVAVQIVLKIWQKGQLITDQ